MPDYQIPSSSGARTAGDFYQWLYAWRVCMEALHDDNTHNSVNPTIAVGIEEPGVGNADDVVRHRQQPPHAYMQVKYAVDHRTPFGLAYLDDKDILRKMVATHATLTADGTPVEMRLITNRASDPDDLLLRDRDGRDNKLVPRAAQGGATSHRGQARAAWAEAAGTDEQALMKFLRDTHFDVASELPSLRQQVSLLMTANGLRSEEAAVDQGATWIGQQVMAGRRHLTLTDIKDAVADLNLQAGSPWTRVSVATIKHDALGEEAAASIDWVDNMAGETPETRVSPAPPHTWDDLAADLAELPTSLGSSKRVLVGGHLRQATGFLVGTELRRVRGYEVAVLQNAQLWTSETETPPYEFTIDEQSVDAGHDIGLIVNVAANAAGVANQWMRRAELPLSHIITATPASGTGPKALTGPVAANSAAVALRDIARAYADAPALHLILIGPLGLSVLLGHHWNRMPHSRIYEHLGGTQYAHAFSVDA